MRTFTLLLYFGTAFVGLFSVNAQKDATELLELFKSSTDKLRKNVVGEECKLEFEKAIIHKEKMAIDEVMNGEATKELIDDIVASYMEFLDVNKDTLMCAEGLRCSEQRLCEEQESRPVDDGLQVEQITQATDKSGDDTLTRRQNGRALELEEPNDAKSPALQRPAKQASANSDIKPQGRGVVGSDTVVEGEGTGANSNKKPVTPSVANKSISKARARAGAADGDTGAKGDATGAKKETDKDKPSGTEKLMPCLALSTILLAIRWVH